MFSSSSAKPIPPPSSKAPTTKFSTARQSPCPTSSTAMADGSKCRGPPLLHSSSPKLRRKRPPPCPQVCSSSRSPKLRLGPRVLLPRGRRMSPFQPSHPFPHPQTTTSHPDWPHLANLTSTDNNHLLYDHRLATPAYDPYFMLYVMTSHFPL
ncbi:hypothetical protein KSP40_PGU019275 [Platanthera guangdongensis]|uniref:Uncharacterized protein n=1 Tax=Platanthera guangdongensis TaxID=2320717 RepID=A0ABR2MBC4_9ASPA